MSKQYYEVDSNGKIINTHVFSDGDIIPPNHFLGWSGTMFNPVWDFDLQDWREESGYDQILRQEKDKKIQELNHACSQTILGRFFSDVNGITYSFSNDMEAQANFEKADRAFERGLITEILWTAHDVNGDVVRLTLDATAFEGVYIDHLSHIQDNISKFRDVLMPQVESCTTVEEVNSIKWE